jgi:hypothetical protein
LHSLKVIGENGKCINRLGYISGMPVCWLMIMVGRVKYPIVIIQLELSAWYPGIMVLIGIMRLK